MRLGSLDITTDLALAPLMDVTTPSFRQLICDLGGVGFVVAPMLFVQQFVAAPKTIVPHLELIERQRPAAVQLVCNGKNPEHLHYTLDYLSSYNFDLIDINAGCPAPHTMRSGGGGGFLKEYHLTHDFSRLENVIQTTLKYSPFPVSLKTRLGFHSETDIFDLLPIINNVGLEFLILHGRTIEQKYRGRANYTMIKKVKEQLEIPLIANGDVIDYSSYLAIKHETECDAVMIGRAAMFDPAIFSKIVTRSKTDNKTDNISTSSLKDMNKTRIEDNNGDKDMNQLAIESQNTFHSLKQIREYLTKIESYIEDLSKFWNNDRFKLAEIRRLSIWWIKGIPGYKKVREVISKINNFQRLKAYVFGDQIEKDFELFKK
ncbi:tRNA dihydrouridine synthase [Candidatus Harpocratesius sp.]